MAVTVFQAPVEACMAAECSKCHKTTWRVRRFLIVIPTLCLTARVTHNRAVECTSRTS